MDTPPAGRPTVSARRDRRRAATAPARPDSRRWAFGRSRRSHDRRPKVDWLSGLGNVVAAHEQHDIGIAVRFVPRTDSSERPRAGFFPRAQHVSDQTRVDAEPAHERTVAAPGDHADPPLGAGHPPERHRRLGHHRRVAVLDRPRHCRHRRPPPPPPPPPPRRPASRRVGDSMNTTCPSVTPMSCCHVARSSETDCALRRPPLASHSPRRNQTSLSPPARRVGVVTHAQPVVHREEHPGSVRRHPMHVRGDGHRQAASELFRRQQAGVLRRQARLGQRQHRAGMPEDTGIRRRVDPQVRHRLAVAQLHGVERTPGRPGATVR